MATNYATLQQFINATYVPEFNSLEDSLFQLFMRLDIDNATGQSLKNLSEMVGAGYYSEDNLLMTRAIIRGTIAAMNSRGTIYDIDNAFKIITGNTNSRVIVSFPKALELYSAVDYDADIAAVILQKMRQAVGADIQIIALIYDSSLAATYDIDYYDSVAGEADRKFYAKILAS